MVWAHKFITYDNTVRGFNKGLICLLIGNAQLLMVFGDHAC